jgi:GH24 family phage-related lysozyme (muramidase)
VRPAVSAIAPKFTDAFEGKLSWMYLDVKCLVTTGRGNLIDPVTSALALPWYHRSNNAVARPDEITREWMTVKSMKSMAPRGGMAFASMTDLRLSDPALDQLFFGKVDEMWTTLAARFSCETWCADAQLGLLSMAWALGPHFAFPKFQAAVAVGDWATAAGPPGDASLDPSKRGQSWMEDNHLPGSNPANPGLHRRNLANKVLFTNAQYVAADPCAYDPGTLYYPAGVTPAALPPPSGF